MKSVLFRALCLALAGCLLTQNSELRAMSQGQIPRLSSQPLLFTMQAFSLPVQEVGQPITRRANVKTRQSEARLHRNRQSTALTFFTRMVFLSLQVLFLGAFGGGLGGTAASVPQPPEEHVRMKIDRHVMTITLARPKVNALSLEMVRSLHQMIRQAEEDDTIHVILIRAEGKLFSAGGDIKWLTENIQAGHWDLVDQFCTEEYAMDLALARLAEKKEVISLVDGYVIGGGFGLVAASRRIVAGENTRFMMPENGIGLFPDVGMTYYMPVRMGRAVAKYYGFTGEDWTAEEARRMGWNVSSVARADFDQLEEDIKTALMSGQPESYASLIEKISQRPLSPDQEAEQRFTQKLEAIQKYFDKDDLRDILSSLKAHADQDPFARQTYETIRKQSYTSLQETNRLFNIHGHASVPLEAVFAEEDRAGALLLRHPDFSEGVSATLGFDLKTGEKGEKREAQFLWPEDEQRVGSGFFVPLSLTGSALTHPPLVFFFLFVGIEVAVWYLQQKKHASSAPALQRFRAAA